jgi:hypothetical protein
MGESAPENTDDYEACGITPPSLGSDLLGMVGLRKKFMKIEVTLPRGAYLLFIDRIDGESYQGDK